MAERKYYCRLRFKDTTIQGDGGWEATPFCNNIPCYAKRRGADFNTRIRGHAGSPEAVPSDMGRLQNIQRAACDSAHVAEG